MIKKIPRDQLNKPHWGYNWEKQAAKSNFAKEQAKQEQKTLQEKIHQQLMKNIKTYLLRDQLNEMGFFR